MQPSNSPERLSVPVLMAHGRPTARARTLRTWGNTKSTERDAMKNTINSQTFRVVMLLSALASSSLVLMAGRRWF